MERVRRLRDTAYRYRQLAEVAGDAGTRELRLNLAAHFDRQADERERSLREVKE
jgi:hypothetical protein